MTKKPAPKNIPYMRHHAALWKQVPPRLFRCVLVSDTNMTGKKKTIFGYFPTWEVRVSRDKGSKPRTLSALLDYKYLLSKLRTLLSVEIGKRLEFFFFMFSRGMRAKLRKLPWGTDVE